VLHLRSALILTMDCVLHVLLLLRLRQRIVAAANSSTEPINTSLPGSGASLCGPRPYLKLVSDHYRGFVFGACEK
jgi:hypothetical protein